MFSCSCPTKFVFRLVKVVCDCVDRSLWNDAVRAKPKLCFSPTAIASGWSAITKVSGQNCFRTFYGSRSVLGCQKVPRNLSPSSSPLSCIFFNNVSLGVFSHIVKSLGQNDIFVFLGSLQQMIFAS